MSSLLITLITGANQGIGYHTAQHLASTGKHHILLGARTIEKGRAAAKQLLVENPSINPSSIEELEIDLNDDESVSAAAEVVKNKYGYLDILINNAAVAGYPPKEGESLREIYKSVFDTNVTGTAVVTEAFLPLIKASKASAPGRRIVFVSSELASLTIARQAYYGALYVQYNCSKSALNMLALHYRSVLEQDGIVSIMTSPGFCETNLNGFTGRKKPSDGAMEIVKAATVGGIEMSGRFIRDGKDVPW